MHVLMTNFNGNPNIGLYGIITDKYFLLGSEIPTDRDNELKKVCSLPIKRLTIAGTSLLGVFCLWTKETLLIPDVVFDHELKMLDDLKIKYKIIKTTLTCLGNNVLVGKSAAILNPEFKADEVKQIQQALQIPVKQRKIMEIEAVGALGVIISDKGLFHRDISLDEQEELESILDIKITTGTVNLGNPYIRSGIIAFKDGFFIGSASGGPEVANADEALGFIEV